MLAQQGHPVRRPDVAVAAWCHATAQPPLGAVYIPGSLVFWLLPAGAAAGQPRICRAVRRGHGGPGAGRAAVVSAARMGNAGCTCICARGGQKGRMHPDERCAGGASPCVHSLPLRAVASPWCTQSLAPVVCNTSPKPMPLLCALQEESAKVAAVRRGYQRALLVPSPQVTATLQLTMAVCLAWWCWLIVGWQARGQPAKGKSIMIWCRFMCVTPALPPTSWATPPCSWRRCGAGTRGWRCRAATSSWRAACWTSGAPSTKQVWAGGFVAS